MTSNASRRPNTSVNRTPAARTERNTGERGGRRLDDTPRITRLGAYRPLGGSWYLSHYHILQSYVIIIYHKSQHKNMHVHQALMLTHAPCREPPPLLWNLILPRYQPINVSATCALTLEVGANRASGKTSQL